MVFTEEPKQALSTHQRKVRPAVRVDRPKAVHPGRVLLVIEDHPICQDALIRLLGKPAGLGDVVVAGSAEEGLRMVAALDVRLILLDIWLPGMSGIEALPAFRRLCPAAPVVFFSAADSHREVAATLRAGATAFVSKAAPLKKLRSTVQRAMNGAIRRPECVLPEDRGEMLDDVLPALTRRQKQIISLLSRGMSNKEIALQLGLAEITVKQHVSGILRTLNVTNRTQAVLAARRLGVSI
ncbi:MAG: response regulator transcription factor [Ectothiorhodospiraceae bacterium]|nr:response regulator transcription factor [Ectothiorhodospiraceae bacterium]